MSYKGYICQSIWFVYVVTISYYHLKHTIKANPSPNRNGFAFNLFGKPVNYPGKPILLASVRLCVKVCTGVGFLYR